jgi:hypothetical protein
VVDIAGNVGGTDSQAITIDTTAPTATVNIAAIASDSGPRHLTSSRMTRR